MYRKKNKSFSFKKVLCLFIVFTIGFYLLIQLIPNKQKVKAQQIASAISSSQALQANADLQKAILQQQTNNAKRMIQKINEDVEIILLTETGTYKINHDKTVNDSSFQKFFVNSQIEINLKYQAILSIPISGMNVINTNGTVSVKYDESKIQVKSVEITNFTSKETKSLFGSSYNSTEVLALENIAKDKIREQINNDNSTKQKAKDNLDKFLVNVADTYGVNKVESNDTTIKNTGYEFKNMPTIAYNHDPNAYISPSVQYIVIHSTAVKDVDAMSFYNMENKSQTERKSSAHFYIDDTQCLQVLPTNLADWSVGNSFDNKKIHCANSNSISLEMCEFTDQARQEKVIQNCADFVKNVLSKEFLQAKIVMHREIMNTDCPEILTDSQFNTLFKTN